MAKSCPLDNLFLCSEPESVNADPVFMALQERSCFSILSGLGSKIKEVPAAPHRRQLAAARAQAVVVLDAAGVGA